MTGAPQDPAADAPPVGAVLGGRYEVRGRLGAGGMADVLSVRERGTGRELALKVLRPEVAAQPEAVERLRREASILASIAHPTLVSVEASGTLQDGRVFLAMERLHGETLRDRMRRGPMAPAELAPILERAAEGLSAAHQRGVLHRDLKPDNLFLCEGGTPDAPQVKILDFGVSKVLGQDHLTRTGQIVGTPRYMAPEQLTAERDLDARVDVYALGVIAYEALAGQPPFLASTPADLIVAVLHGVQVPLRSLRVDLPPGLEAVVMRAMHRDRETRMSSVDELARAFAHHARGPSPPARGGMRTDALGSMDVPPSAAPREGARPPGLLPGTYGAL
ncbi:MAG: serine/threonine-protein kinase, partial [Myxococcota bacterium]